MEQQRILECLCAYDKRNPYYDVGTAEDRKEHCYCDNCFYGRTALAEEILRLQSKE